MRKLILIFLLACSACATQANDPARKDRAAPASAAAPAPAAGGDTLARIRALAGSAACTESSQCRSLPVGATPCGGPESYLSYSTASTDEQVLRALGERHKAERQAQIRARGLTSICRHLPDPGAVCTAGACRLGDSAAAPR
jgi:hypothetical protein